jgi:hypothetical protein
MNAHPITGPQAAYLGRLIAHVRKPKYQQVKQRLGLPENVTMLQLSRGEAARLIEALRGEAARLIEALRGEVNRR